MEPARDEVQLRRRLSDPDRLPDVPADEGQGAPGKKSLPELHLAHELAARLRDAESGRALPNRSNAEPNAGGQRGSQGEDARLAESAARALERGRQVPAAGDHRTEADQRRG